MIFLNVTNFWDYLNQNEFWKSKMGYTVAGPKLAQGFGLLAIVACHG
jgi:hypothetical protein